MLTMIDKYSSRYKRRRVLTSPALPRLLLTLFIFSCTSRQPKAPRKRALKLQVKKRMSCKVWCVSIVHPALIFIRGSHGSSHRVAEGEPP